MVWLIHVTKVFAACCAFLICASSETLRNAKLRQQTGDFSEADSKSENPPNSWAWAQRHKFSRYVPNQMIERPRYSNVLNYITRSIESECVSDDGLRIGICLNVYECRLHDGVAKGECALGFGTCCVFVKSCGEVAAKNLTYFVSPNFPALLSTDSSYCRIQVKVLNEDVSQLRIDFKHFLLGQPNRSTGICDGDVLFISGGLNQTLKLCGLNSGQHVYYDVGDKTAYPNTDSTCGQKTKRSCVVKDSVVSHEIEISIHFSGWNYTPRFWEILITQIPFSQRAPIGCLQHFTGTRGTIQTFNFAENGRHLANQNYKVCIRQEAKMCSIAYEPCHEHAFKIGAHHQTDILSVPSAHVSTIPTTVGTNLNDDSNQTQLNSEDYEESSGGGQDSTSKLWTRSLEDGFSSELFFQEMVSFYRGRNQDRRVCTDRITIPCILEDFLGQDSDSIAVCDPTHCGNSFCLVGTVPCRVESTVTPFELRVVFGNGFGKGTPEDNIGACLKYHQLKCL